MINPQTGNNRSGGNYSQLRSNCTIRLPAKISRDITFITAFKDISPLHSNELVTLSDLKKAIDSIRLVEISKAIGHEQTIESELRAKSKKLKNADAWPFPLIDITENGIGEKHPVPVQHNRVLILNGHHKFATLQKHGYILMPAFVHDYDTEVRIGAWYPIVTVPFTSEIIAKFAGSKCNFDVGRGMIESKSAYFML